jgi:very-short-patch-repair endonuclease
MEVVNMTRKLSTSDVNNLVKLYLSGERTVGISHQFNVTVPTVLSRLRERNIPIRKSGPTCPSVPLDEAIRLYGEGIGIVALGERYGVDAMTVRKRLDKAGVCLRKGSDANLIRWRNMSVDERTATVEAAHNSVRGVRKSSDNLRRKALTIEHLAKGSYLENQLHSLLVDAGLSPVPQVAVGRYNIDLAIAPLAVEVWGGDWHMKGHHASIFGERTRQLFDCGWSVLHVIVSQRQLPTAVTAKNVVAFLDIARSLPPNLRKYWVIRRDGQIVTFGSSDDKNISVVPATSDSEDSSDWFD